MRTHARCLAVLLVAPFMFTLKPDALAQEKLPSMVRAVSLDEMQQDSTSSSSNLVQLVRAATQQYINVNAATAAGYAPFLGCVTGPEHGAMGVHYVNGTLLGAGEIDASHPQALIYEPSDGAMRLVGVEFIVLAASWLNSHNNNPPVLEGQVFQFVDSPNRFNIPAFFELHVWAWRDNPQGAFVDWNNQVTCEGKQ
ncbi:MAG TPA: hypothetical protein VMR02_15080 [Terracidiphilus sp.]|jgi:hypothetical protein|nr:hypothetical protein [Terracidiphilus sp.]